MSELKRTELKVGDERAVLVQVTLPDSTADPRDPMGEISSLVKTAGAVEVARVTQNRDTPHPGLYVGTGKAKEIAKAAKKNKANLVVFDNDLTPAQIGGLEQLINRELKSPRLKGVKIIDRSELILDIFAARATTHEAKLQVELAQMEYTYPRLTRMWGHLERIAAGGAIGIGTRGPGEQQLEIDRRLVRNRIGDLKTKIGKVQTRKAREVEKRNNVHFTVCVVGYTNAGKSTFFNTVTDAGTYADDKLFATLDTKTRAWHITRNDQVLLSDTVGFVRDLPHDLVASFKATLEEAVHADLLLHVIDVGHPHADKHYESVLQVLEEIGADDKPALLLLNKVDTPEGEQQMPYWRALHPDALAISAKTGTGIDTVRQAVEEAVRGEQADVTLLVDATNGELLAFLEANSQVHHREVVDDEKIRVNTIMGKRLLTSLRRNEDAEIINVQDALVRT
ncbi:MAG: GTPase HflX [Planctomycetota bacterium]